MTKKRIKLKATQPRREQRGPRGTFAASGKPGASKVVAKALQRDGDRGRKQLHAAVDRLLDGPGTGDMDRWATEVLASLGYFVRAARFAIDYEVGRILHGVDRRHGSFPIGNDVYPAWEGAWIDVEDATADEWCQRGGDSRGAYMPPETVQRALAAILYPIASTSYHPWLFELSDALDALRFGEQPSVLKPSARGLRSIGQARTEYTLRLTALAWVQFQVAAGLSNKTQAIGDVATAFEKDERSIRSWDGSVVKELGAARVDEVMTNAQVSGACYRMLLAQVDEGNPRDRSAMRYKRHYKNLFGDEALKSLAEAWARLPRKDFRDAHRCAPQKELRGFGLPIPFDQASFACNPAPSIETAWRRAIMAKAKILRSAAIRRGLAPDQVPQARRKLRLLAWPMVHDRVDLSRTTVWRLIRTKAFPAPVRLSEGRVAWFEDDIEAWITARSEG